MRWDNHVARMGKSIENLDGNVKGRNYLGYTEVGGKILR
jgi:hypothetical protein